MTTIMKSPSQLSTAGAVPNALDKQAEPRPKPLETAAPMKTDTQAAPSIQASMPSMKMAVPGMEFSSIPTQSYQPQMGGQDLMLTHNADFMTGATDTQGMPRVQVGDGTSTYPSSPAPSGLPLQPFGPQSTLRNQQINPTVDGRLSATQAGVDNAAQSVANAPSLNLDPNADPYTNQAGSYAGEAANEIGNVRAPTRGAIAGSDVSGANRAYGEAGSLYGAASGTTDEAMMARQMMLQDLQGLEGPDRGQIASDTLNRLVTDTEPQFQEALRGVGQDAAKFGRLGSGITTSRLGDVLSEREAGINSARQGLASEAAGLQLQDALNVYGARAGASSQLTGEDLARGGFDLSRGSAQQGLGSQLEGMSRANRGEQVGERDFAAGQDITQANLAGSRANALAALSDQSFGRGSAIRGEQRLDSNTAFDQNRAALSDLSQLEGQQYGQDRGYRDELRSERGYQDDLARDATDQQVRQLQLEDALLNSSFNRDTTRLGQLSQVGYGTNPPSQELQNQAWNLGGQSDAQIQSLMQFLSSYGATQGG